MTAYPHVSADNHVNVQFGGGSLLQIASRCPCQMMSYLIETPDGKTVMIDSGFLDEKNTQHLLELLKLHGNVVDIWFITHAHADHFGCLHWILENYATLDITIRELRFSFPPREWICTCEPSRADVELSFLQAVESSGVQVLPLRRGDILSCGGMEFEILNDYEHYARYNSINDTSAVILAKFPRRSVLFLGDLGARAGQDLLATGNKQKLRCDIVQMAHHGQNGVDRLFYEAVGPKICLYPTPDWLWDCDTGGGKGTDLRFRTLETRRWMEELAVERSCVSADGDYWLE